MSNAKRAGTALLYVAFNLLVASAIVETVFVVMLHSPTLTLAAPAPLRRLVQQVYRHFTRGLIQFDASCARYDPEVTYTLRPGTCTFANLEFTNTYSANRLGLRDDEAALTGPDVIVLGDSHAMGWGVEQHETFAHVLARATGRRVLNAAVSSYATAREMIMLDRLDTSRLRVLVVQYADNDEPENRTFEQQRNHLPIASHDQYQRIVDHYAAQRDYYPGKYVSRLFLKIFRLEAPEPDQLKMDVLSPAREAELFVNAMVHGSRVSLDGVQLVVLEINQDFRHPRSFIAALNDVRRRPSNPPFVQQLRTLDSTSVLSAGDFYVLDDHMNRGGHERVGQALAPIVGRAASH